MTKKDFLKLLSVCPKDSFLLLQLISPCCWWETTWHLTLYCSTQPWKVSYKHKGKTGFKDLGGSRGRKSAEKKAQMFQRWAKEVDIEMEIEQR